MAWTSKEKKQFRLAAIAPENQDLSAVAFNLIEWAEAKGRLDDLYDAFLEENPRRDI